MQPVGDSVGLVDEDVWFNAREPIAQTFVKDGDASPSWPTTSSRRARRHRPADNVDAGNGQGQWNGDRTRQAASLASFTDELRDVDR